MSSLPCSDDAPQWKATRGQSHSIGQRRHRATVEARQLWSARLTMAALHISGSRGTARNVLVALLLLANGKREVSVSQPEIADLSGVGLDQTRRCLRELRHLGEISVSRKGRGRGRCNSYRLHLLDAPSGTDGDAA